jgi:uncharacterized membrane protein
MMLERSVEVEVGCSVEEVYELWKNLENMPRWMPLVKEVKVQGGAEELSRWKFGLRFPLLTEWTSRITQRIPERLIAWESVSGLPNNGFAEFSPTEQGCRLRLSLTFELPGGIAGTLLDAIGIDSWLESNLVESLYRFKEQIEQEVIRQRKQ